MKATQRIDALFDGKKSKWLPLYHRLLARFSNVSGVEFFPFEKFIGIGNENGDKHSLGEIRITSRGLEIGLGLTRSFTRSERLRTSKRNPAWITHRVMIAKASEIDEEFMSWVKAARHQARTSKPQSTSPEAPTASSPASRAKRKKRQ